MTLIKQTVCGIVSTQCISCICYTETSNLCKFPTLGHVTGSTYTKLQPGLRKALTITGCTVESTLYKMYRICSHTNTWQLEVLPLGKHLGYTYLCVGMFYHASLWYAFTACLSCNNYKHSYPVYKLYAHLVNICLRSVHGGLLPL